jgi:Ulp1 family protease
MSEVVTYLNGCANNPLTATTKNKRKFEDAISISDGGNGPDPATAACSVGLMVDDTTLSCSPLPNGVGGDDEGKGGGNFFLGITTSTMKLSSLSTKQKNKIDKIWNSANEGNVITNRRSIQLTAADYKMLMPGNMIGSDIIDSWLDILRQDLKGRRCKIFSAMFYSKLVSFHDGINRTYEYNAVRKWTTMADSPVTTSGIRKLCIPVHQPLHWIVAVVNFTTKTIGYYDSSAANAPSAVANNALANIKQYLKDEQADKMQAGHGIAGWDFDKWASIVYDVTQIPQQCRGSNDCGMFMLKFIEFEAFDLDIKKIIPERMKTEMRYRTASEIWKGTLLS